MQNKSCTPRRWQLLRQELNNLLPLDFARALDKKKEGLLIDVRTPEEFQQAHLPGAINISYLTPDLWDQLEQLDRNAAYFVYCRTERRSMRVCMLMQNGGFEKVYNMEGGLCAWEEVFGPVEALSRG
ncbi:MAG: rhodanese-like domain-containing protein [Lewinellaceae bacterium]|nr:rhodanese-like domain-containing protein [Phaeodactylibacter sp.]MCB0613126.1 rhodanese-like domain-containing protein [Phaeodactylibacter sp.]MCB9351580.1 rhodanese-like domain-containing protein [Lewinellaceae bacterium]